MHWELLILLHWYAYWNITHHCIVPSLTHTYSHTCVHAWVCALYIQHTYTRIHIRSHTHTHVCTHITKRYEGRRTVVSLFIVVASQNSTSHALYVLVTTGLQTHEHINCIVSYTKNTFQYIWPSRWLGVSVLQVVIILQDMLNSEHITTASFKDKLFSVTTEQFHSKISIRSNNRTTTTAQTHNEHFPYHDQNCGGTKSATVAWQTWGQLVMLNTMKVLTHQAAGITSIYCYLI